MSAAQGNSSWATELFGATLLQNASTEVKTADVLANNNNLKAIGIYFSAHWCPPCRGFTPKLADFYKTDLKGKGFEVVFVSSDKDEAAFKDYYGEQPWLALPYAAHDGRKLKETLSKKFKVSGIPSLVILDAKTGDVITKDGRTAVMEDPKGESFPWIPKSLSEILESTDYVAHDCEVKSGAEESHYKSAADKTVKYSDFAGKKLGLYFSAHWCPPCRGFTPVLKKTYEKLVAEKGEKFDIIFCSADRDEAQFKDYFGGMPWKALPFTEKKVEKQLSSHFGVNGIPCLVILDENREVISKSAVGKVRADPDAENFPWAPELVNDIDADPEGINDHPCVIVFAENVATEKQAELKEKVLKPCAEFCKTQAKTHSLDAKLKEAYGEFVFFTANAKAGRLSSQIRNDCSLGEAGEKPQAILVDVADDMAFFNIPEDALASAERMQAFLTAFAKGEKPEKKSIKP